jgi:hypothetical protein
MKEITVDIDEDFDEWRHVCLHAKRRQIEDKIAGVKSKWLRRSANNHVHLKIAFNDDLTLLQAFCIRAFLGDDPHRLACDLDRYYRTNKLENTGRCFDEKYTKGKVRCAGKWEKF